MRTVAVLLLFSLVARAQDGAPAAVEPVGDEEAKAAIKEFDDFYRKNRDVEARQNAIYNLHDVPSDLVIRRLESLLKDKDPQIRNVAALALGGQAHNKEKAGEVLMRLYGKDFKTVEVLSSTLEAMAELKYMGYWPTVEGAMKDERNSVVIRILDLLGENTDWRAIPKLLEMYHVALPKRVSWKTGTVTVDTGTAGDGDQKAAEAKFRAKYGRGGSKMKAKAKAKARSFDERNFSSQLRKCVKKITGEDFDNAIDFEDWYVDHYIEVQVKIARLLGEDPEAARRRARAELPALKTKIEKSREQMEAEVRGLRQGDKE
jgi:HEAT repeat protein